MPLMPIIEMICGIVALLFAGAAFVNLAWSEGSSSAKMKLESSRKTKRLFLIAGIFAAITVINGSTGEQAASFCERVDPSKIADVVDKLGRFYRTPQIAPN